MARRANSHHRRRRWLALLGATAGVAASVRFGNDAIIAGCESRAASVSVGTPAQGSLRAGRRLPTSGANFAAYSLVGALLGRNSVHARVRDAVLDAYATCERTAPGRSFVYGEASWPGGGRLRPHRTHQNGLSVDFMVPVTQTADGRPTVVPTNVLTRWGYALEFDAQGRSLDGALAIDFGAIAAHLTALAEAARTHRLVIARVIFDSPLQRELFRAAAGAPLARSLPFTGRAWVRHDEHYHVDFALQ